MCAIHVKNLKETLIESYCKIMKKFIKNLSLLAVVASLGFMMSCNEDEETFNAPILTIESSQLDSEFSFEGAPGTPLSYTVVVSSEAGFNTLYGGGAVVATKDPGTTPTTFEFPVSEEIPATDGTYTTEYYAVDEAGQESNRITVTVVVVKGIITHTQTLLGGQSNSQANSFYNAFDDETYNYATTRDEKSASVDFLFFYGNTNLYTIAAMDDNDANTAFSAALQSEDALGASIIETRNPTRFKALETTAAEFDAIETDAALLNLYGEVAAEATKVNGLEAGDVFAFLLPEGRSSKIGLVKVISTSGTDGSNRAVTIQVKIQE